MYYQCPRCKEMTHAEGAVCRRCMQGHLRIGEITEDVKAIGDHIIAGAKQNLNMRCQFPCGSKVFFNDQYIGKIE